MKTSQFRMTQIIICLLIYHKKKINSIGAKVLIYSGDEILDEIYKLQEGFNLRILDLFILA